MPRADKQLTLEHEKLLWNKKELDLDTSKGLLRAVIFYLIKCFAVWQGKELRQLQTSHISFGENKLGKYVSLDFQSLSFKRRRVVTRYDDPANPRSVYKILKKYRSRIANEGPFLVRPISSIKDFICFGPLPLGVRVIKTFISNLMEDAGIGRCFVNYSLNLQSIDILMRFGTGSHCLSSWLVKNNDKCLRVCPACSSVNCEDINPEVSVMVSRLLDAPCPFDAVEIMQKMEHEEEQRSKFKDNDSEVPLKFDSWMTNLMGGNDEKEMECEQKPKLTETQREYSSDNDKGSKVNVESIDMKKGKMLPKDEKVYNTKEVYTCETSYMSEPKITTVSSITEGAFSLQIDEGDHAGGTSFDKNDKDLKLNSYLETEKERKLKFKFLSGKKRRKVRSENDVESDRAFAKMKKIDDCTEYPPWVLSKEFPDLRLKEEVHERSNIEIRLAHCKSEIKSNDGSGRDKVHELRQDVENEAMNFEEKAVQNKQPLFTDKSLNNCTSTSIKSGVVKDFKSKKELSCGLRASSSKCKFNLPFPDSSQDSITILRMLLQGQSDNKSKSCGQRKCADANIEKNKSSQNDKRECANATIDKNKCTGNQNCKNDCVINGLVCGNDKKNVSEKGDNEDSCSEKCEIIVGREENDEDKQMVVDLSPPTLSPQPVTSSHEIINDIDNENNDINNHLLSPGSQCAPNFVSPDIVQFLNKAHQQIKHILNATTTKNTIQDENGRYHPIKSIVSQPPEKDVSYKHSSKSWKPVKIITSTSEDSLSPKVDSVAEESDSDAFTSLKPSKPLEQSPSQFPLLRLFLEQPMERTELMMSSHSTLSSTLQSNQKKQVLLPSNSSSHLHDETDLTQLPQLTYMGDATSSQLTYMEDATSSPQLTYMGNATSFQEMDNSEDDIHKNHHSIDEAIKSKKGTIKNKRSHSNMAVLSANDQECPCIDLSPQSPSPTSVPLLPASPPLDCQQSNAAVYHVEKDLINNAVYQTLRVNYEKDGVRTFTFADIPNVPENPSHSKKFQGSRQTSEISLGDYFPPGTLIPAKDIHLVTQQGSTGCDIVMKFSFCPKN